MKDLETSNVVMRIQKEGHSNGLLDYSMLSAVFSSIPYGVIYTDIQHNIVAMNKEAEEITGYTSSEVEGSYCGDILKHTDDNGVMLCLDSCHLDKIMREGREFYTELWLLTKSGKRKPIGVKCSPVYDGDGNLVGAVEVFRDRTEQEEIAQLREELMATLTHDLKAPVVSILGFLDLLESKCEKESSKDKLGYIHNIQRIAEMLLSQIGNILDASRIETDQITYNFDNLSLNKLFDELANIFESMAITNNIKIDFICPEGVWINGDREKIRRIFNNLISNALRYSPNGGVIRVEAVPGDERVTIEVADEGCGIPESEHERIFEKYSQVKGERQGSGLGLFIVKKFLEGHGSNISVDSSPGEGARFIFNFARGVAPAVVPLMKGRLLLVSFEPDNLQLFETALNDKEGHEIETAGGGMEALFKISQNRPDVVIVFHPMPDLSPEELEYSVKFDQECTELPIILISSVSSSRWKEKFSAVIPFDITLLSKVIQKTLTKSKTIDKVGCRPPEEAPEA